MSNRKRGLAAAVLASAATVALVMGSALPASAANHVYDFGGYTSSPKGATADGPANHQAIVSTKNSQYGSTGVHAILYDVASDGKGATFRAYITYYTSKGYYDGQQAKEGRNTDGYGTHKPVDLAFAWPDDAATAVITVYVCNGKNSSGGNINCGAEHSFNL